MPLHTKVISCHNPQFDMSFTSATTPSKVSSIIQKLRTRVRLVPFLILFLLKVVCSLVVLNFYMATHISTVMQQQNNKIDSSFSMMYPKGGYIVDVTTLNNTQDTKNSKIPNTQTPTNDIENERMIFLASESQH